MATEKRLIDANALYIKLGKLAREPDYQHEGEDWGVGVAMAMGEVWCEPTVDAVEVVRCEDCSRWKRTGDCRHGICCLDGVKLLKWNYEFCNRGERRTEA